MQIRDRIKELRRVKASELRPSPSNWRTHPKGQRDALQAVLAEVGYADALLARELPDGSLELIDGHLRAETTPDMEVPVLVLDVTEAEAKKILATLDPLAAMAEASAEKLDALLREVDTGSEALQKMLADLAVKSGVIPGEKGEYDPNAEWQGMPEFEQGDNKPFRTIIVHLGSQEAVDEFSALIGQPFSESVKYIWHPKQVKENLKAITCIDEP
jgi:hypothetical protein